MSGAELTPGETEVCGTQVKVVVEGFLRSVFSRDGVDMAQIVFSSDNGFSSYQAVIVPRRLVRVPPARQGARA
jgi:hypothetical protein